MSLPRVSPISAVMGGRAARIAALRDADIDQHVSDFGELRQRVEQFCRLPSTPSGYTIARPADCRRITDTIRRYVERNVRHFTARDPKVLIEINEILDLFAGSAIRVYPKEALHLDVLRAEVQYLAGRNEEALAIVAPLAERPYRFERDLKLFERVVILDTMTRLVLGRGAEVQALAYGWLVYLSSLEWDQAPRLFESFHRPLSIGKIDWSRIGTLPELMQLLAKLRIRSEGWRRELTLDQAWRFLLRRFSVGTAGLLLLVGLWFVGRRSALARLQLIPGNGERQAATCAPKDILVSRAMGGLGDIAMMSPGLTALARTIGRPIHFATKRAFWPLLENNPDIILLDIDSDINLGRFRRWRNLSFCPAERYESKAAPNIRKGRVELFAAGMGVRRGQLDRHGWSPVCKLSSEQERLADDLRLRWVDGVRPIIGVQPFSRELYRSYGRMSEVVERLAQSAKVVLFHSSPLPESRTPAVEQFVGRPLKDTIAGVSACDYFLAVDSALFHIAAAFDVPTLGVFGPTKGAIRADHYPCAKTLEADGFGCQPCWRSEDVPCLLTGGVESACLAAIRVDEVISAMAELQKRFPPARGRARLGSGLSARTGCSSRAV